MPAWLIIIITVAYMAGLFAIAAQGDKDGERPGYRPNPWVFPLALAVYCTSWTYFGAVGTAAESGWDYLPIYLGPAIVFLLMSGLLRRIGEVVKRESVSSLSDFLSARYGKSPAVGAAAALAAVMGGLPYIALQLKSIGMSFGAFVGAAAPGFTPGDETVLFTALALAAFSVLYGTRFPDATRPNTGLMRVLAIEALVKIGALAAVALMALLLIGGGRIEAPPVGEVFSLGPPDGRFIALIILSMAAIVCLPHEFHVAMIERRDDSEFRLARFVFPAYLLITSLVVVPITLAGMGLFHNLYPADLFVLQLPVSQGNSLLAMLVFLGGFSAATGMVIVSTIALSNMVTNDLIVPLMMRSGNFSRFGENAGARLVSTRRTVIVTLLLLAYGYYRFSGPGEALAQIGLLAFVAASQFAPAVIAAVYWRGARGAGVLTGLIAGMIVWLYTLFLPSLLGWQAVSALMPAWLDPHALFGASLGDPLTHGAIWSLGTNTALMVIISLRARERLRDRVQAAAFVGLDPGSPDDRGGVAGPVRGVSANGLKTLAARFLTVEAVEHAFEEFTRQTGITSTGDVPADGRLVQRTERLLASVLGASSARVVLASAIGGNTVALPDVLSMLDSRTQAERFERHMLQSMLENIAQGISVVNAEQKLVAWNSAYVELFQYPPELVRVGTPVDELIAHNVVSGWISSDAGDPIQRRIRHMRAGAPHVIERRAPDGRWLRITGAPMPGGGYVTTFTDITADKLREQALIESNETLESRVRERTRELERLTCDLVVARQDAEEANASKTRFLAAASHDLLQPLNAARLLLGAAGSGRGDADAIRKADRAIQSADELLRGLLDVSRLDHGAMTPRPVKLPIGPLLEDLVDENIPMAEEVGIEMRIVPTRLSIEADPDFLKSILRNFISNARRYTAQGTVLVGARRRGDYVRIEVWDTGPGIPEDARATIFEEFRRVADTDNTGKRGAGIGLAVARRLAEILGVEIGVESWLGRGSVFWVRVPAATAQSGKVASVNAPSRTAAADLHGLRVLFVDDETGIAEAMQLLLEDWGCEIRTESGPSGFLEAVSRQVPDVVIADYDLRANLTGFDLIAAARGRLADSRNALVITAAADVSLAGRASAAGIALMRKPVSPAELKAFLSVCAGRVNTQAAE